MINQKINARFSELGIAPRLLEAIDRLRFTEPTPIQKGSIPVALTGKDLIGIAQTGTGKTLAFGIPMLQRLEQVKGRGLVVLPTRELAIQVDEALRSIGRNFGLRTAVLIGGASFEMQRQALNRNPQIIVVTPGRLIDHLERRTVRLSDVKILVLDEADRMLDMGFAPQIRKIFAAVPRQRQTMLFSATMPQEIVTIARQNMELPIHVEIARSGTTVEQVSQEVFFLAKEDKNRLLEELLHQYKGSVLVFTRTRYGARKLACAIRGMNHSAAEIHSDRTLGQRREALNGFKSGKYRVLAATDIAARGIDVTGIELVVNYDLPMQAEDYVHRIGRTARAGRTGKAISFATFDQRRDVTDIEHLIRSALQVSKLPEVPQYKWRPGPVQNPVAPFGSKSRTHRFRFGRPRIRQSRGS